MPLANHLILKIDIPMYKDKYFISMMKEKVEKQSLLIGTVVSLIKVLFVFLQHIITRS